MCLFVTHVPASYKRSLVIPVWKEMKLRDGVYYTPFQGKKTDADGCLFNSERIYNYRNNCFNYAVGDIHNSDFYYYHDMLSSHIVHSYYDKPKRCSITKILAAYAIGVVAYGYGNRNNLNTTHVGSVGLYLPKLDESKLKRKRVNYLKNNEHNILDLMKLFPTFEEKEEDFKSLGFKFDLT
jgi:hypothetical protein